MRTTNLTKWNYRYQQLSVPKRIRRFTPRIGKPRCQSCFLYEQNISGLIYQWYYLPDSHPFFLQPFFGKTKKKCKINRNRFVFITIERGRERCETWWKQPVRKGLSRFHLGVEGHEVGTSMDAALNSKRRISTTYKIKWTQTPIPCIMFNLPNIISQFKI